jgi:3-oxoacyl-[acyl-carrier protein] reductase
MTDLLLRVAAHRRARRVVEALPLPLPLPRVLERATGPWQRRELAGRSVAVVRFQTGALADAFAHMLADSGALAVLVESAARPFDDAGEAFGARPAAGDKLHAIVLDARDLATPASLAALHAHLPALIARLAACGRLVILGRPARDIEPVAAACAAALDGFTRSAAKELGRRGATANLVTVEPGAEPRAAAIARFLLSARSAFVTAQPFAATTTAPARSLEHVASLDGRIAIVTGAARGIGEATARRLAEEGARVVCVDRPADEVVLAAVATAIGGEMFVADVRDPETPRHLADHVRSRADIIVHNAGVTRDRTLAKMSADEWTAAIDINLDAAIRITSALPLRDGGRVICLSSVAGLAGNVGQTNYAASKAGLVGYVRALAAELAPRGITVNAIAPGFIETRMTATIPFAIREAGRRLSALGQGGLPLDVAEVITFLAQPAAAGLTGAVIRVCGGALIGA